MTGYGRSLHQLEMRQVHAEGEFSGGSRNDVFEIHSGIAYSGYRVCIYCFKKIGYLGGSFGHGKFERNAMYVVPDRMRPGISAYG